MRLTIHHLNCGTICPYSARLLNGEDNFFSPGHIVCHCLLIETNDGLVLVDTGLGTMDITTSKTLRWEFKLLARPKLDLQETAVRHVSRLGFKTEDVRHIVLTHLDVDHAGGLPDFPKAQVHIFGKEHEAALHPQTRSERFRYVKHHWQHGPNWVIHELAGETWLGFDSVQALDAGITEILLIPLHGHTRGHCGVAVRRESGWLLHCGDAYFFHGEMAKSPYGTPLLDIFQRLMEIDRNARLHNQSRLRQLAQDKAGEVTLFCAHDSLDFSRFE